MLKVGDHVIYIGDRATYCFPPKGTKGVIKEIDRHDSRMPYLIQWEGGVDLGGVGGPRTWWAHKENVRASDDFTNYNLL